MMLDRKSLQKDIEQLFSNCASINSFKIHGSLSSEKSDIYSDLDYQITVSGVDNGEFLFELIALFSKNFDVNYFAAGFLFMPDLYLLTVHIKDSSIFHFVDIECLGCPHYKTVFRTDSRFDPYRKNTILKLLIHCLKTYLRRNTDLDLLNRLAKRFNIENMDAKTTLIKCFQKFLDEKDAKLVNIAKKGIEYLS